MKPCKKCNKQTSHIFLDLPLCPVCFADFKKCKNKININDFLTLSYEQIHILCFKEVKKKEVKTNKDQTSLF